MTAFEPLQRVITFGGGILVVLSVLTVLRPSVSRLPLPFWLYLLLILWALAALPAVVDLTLFWRYWRRMLQIAVLMACIVFVLQRTGKIGVLLLGYLFAAVTAAVYGVLTGELMESLDPQGQARAASVYSNSNGLAHTCLSGLVAVLFFWDRSQERLLRFVLATTGSLLLLAIIASGSRGAFIGAGCLLASWLWYLRRQVLRKTTYLVGVVIVAIFLNAIVGSVLEGTFLGVRLRRSDSLDSASRETRAQLLFDGWRIFLDHPLTGVGLNQFRFSSDRVAVGHSDVAELPATTGAPGTLFYAGFLASAWRLVTRSERLARRLDPRLTSTLRFCQMVVVLIVPLGLVTMTFWEFESILLASCAIGYALYARDRLTTSELRLPRGQASNPRRTSDAGTVLLPCPH